MVGNGTGRLGGAWGEVRGRNGVIVVCPSVHEDAGNGGRYGWQDTGIVPVLPAPVGALLDDAADAADAATDTEISAFLDAHTDTTRPELLDVWCSTFTRKVQAGESRHQTAVTVATGAMKEARAGYLDARTAADTVGGLFLDAVGRPPVADGRQGDARNGAAARSEWAGVLAWAVAQAEAADLDTVRARVAEKVPGRQLSTAVDSSPDAQCIEQLDDDLREGMHSGQLRMAYRLANSPHRDKLLHVHGVGWHRWDGKRWAYDDQGHAVRAARDVLRRALQASLDLDTDAAKAIRRDVDRCSSATGAAGVLTLAGSMTPFAATVADLDADPYLLNVANGTLDLRTGQLRDHDPADRCTKVTAAAYRPDDTGGPWHTFLERVLPDAEVRSFLQRLTGVALLGRVVEHVLPIATGVGANGKGVFTRSVEFVLGDYAATAESDLFMSRDGQHSTGQMDLLGRRWVTVSETDHGRQLAEATMKRLTGGDTIKARRMRQDFVEFTPSHTPLMVTNHLPAVRGDDPAIWRRIRVIPFAVVIPAAEQDKHLDERLQLQADAVLSWAVAGWRDYTDRGGLDEPEAVKVATRAYRLDSDPVARFIADECIVTPHGYVRAGELYTRWQRWSAEDGAAELAVKAFAQALERKGYPADRVRSAGRVRRGLLLADRGDERDA